MKWGSNSSLLVSARTGVKTKLGGATGAIGKGCLDTLHGGIILGVPGSKLANLSKDVVRCCRG